MENDTTDPMAEIEAMKAIADALSKLGPEATSRVLQWAESRFGGTLDTAKRRKSGEAQGNASGVGNGGTPDFESIADFYAATSPKTDSDRALVAGYWFQYVKGEDDFASQTINTALKNLGHGVSNITKALETLKAQSPALVMQVRKSGTSQQARKKYKLTSAGKKAVDLLVAQQ